MVSRRHHSVESVVLTSKSIRKRFDALGSDKLVEISLKQVFSIIEGKRKFPCEQVHYVLLVDSCLACW